MKTLYLVRHAKSSHDIPFLEDVLRGLSERGKGDAILIGKYLNKQAHCIQAVYSSHSVRTKATLSLMNNELMLPDSLISYYEDLYTFGDDGNTFMRYASQTPDDQNAIMILSHNYSCAYFAHTVSGGKIDNFPTCGLLKVVWDTDTWSDVSVNNVMDVSIMTPKMLKNMV